MLQLLKLLEGCATKEKAVSNKKRKASHDAGKEADTGANNLTSQEMIRILKRLANAETKDDSGQEESLFVEQTVLEPDKIMSLLKLLAAGENGDAKAAGATLSEEEMMSLLCNLSKVKPFWWRVKDGPL